MTPMPNIGQMLSAQARLQPGRIGGRDLEREMSFALWNERACRLANALLGLGLSKGDRLGVLAWNRVEWLEIYAAAAKAGLVAVPVNFRLVASEIRFILQDCSVSAVIAEQELHDSIDEIRGDLELADGRFIHFGGCATPAGWRGYEDLIAAGASTEPEIDVAPADPWCLMYTSGTTGNPKGAIRGHEGIGNLALMTAVELGLGRNDEAMLVMPMCHANSLYFFSSFLHCGAATSVFSRRSFDAERCLRALSETGASFTSLVPTHYEMLLDLQHKAGDLRRMEKLMISSAPARVETKRRVMEMFPNSGLFELYGSTEAGWVTMLHPDEQFDHLGSVGREVVGSLPIRLLDDEGNEVPDGMPGELFSCGPYVFDGYWNRPDKTAEAFRGDYLSVGDVALREPDGFIRLIDRKKNMIISGGENIYPTEVEAILVQHPDVRDVAVVGRPDERWGERVEAAVVLRDGASVTSETLVEWSRGKLAGYKRPRTVTFIGAEEMPRTATGKIQHGVLRELLAVRASNN
ncbi:AMP-binding protein [Nisaea acidiphila]|uniref:3-methylmercaptopropionyl-CoA ligase n=1 Tax=Nisaea acidiphila TaxID=1862145 RepID=A0A9J7AQ22_9PROT|nr:AMP-binding protein [Nisaea acidiphila]UUX49262.1 AMP-binding protein [Nisaea acidiphila]